MSHTSCTTVKEDRSLSAHEIEIVTWMLAHASRSLEHLASRTRILRVVGRCSCGCPSVDFEVEGQALPNGPLAEARGRTADGTEVGLILWGRPDAVTGLEFYELDRPIRSLPAVATLRSE
jgi:hypothetical protein